jgi:hypothetical protein
MAGLLLLALAVVVIYTSRQAFSSPLALVVVAAIGLAALLFQLRLRSDSKESPKAIIHAPLWLNALGLAFAVTAVLADYFHLSSGLMAVSALGALVCFGVSGARVLHVLRKK